MTLIPRNATDEEVLAIIREWIDVHAAEDYAAVAEELGFTCGNYESGAECLRAQIKRYVSPEYFPGATDFVVTDWRKAQGGNPEPKQKVTWYQPGNTELRGAVSFDLPLNGQWSDLTADFVFLNRTSQGYLLALEEIRSYNQTQREMENL